MFSRLVDHCSEVRVIDQTESAKVIAQASFSQFASISSAIMRTLGTPRTTRTKDDLVPMGSMTTSTKDLMSPHWKKRAISRATGVESGEDVANGLAGLSAGREAGAGILLLYLAYLPLGISGGAIAGEVAEHKWQPTIQELQQELQENDPAGMFSSALKTRFSPHGAVPVNLNQDNDPFAPANQPGPKSILQAEILKIELSECEKRGSFCVSVTLRIRLWNTASHMLVYDRVFRYANEKVRTKPSFYESGIGECSECREMEAYRGTHGRKLFKEELSKAIQSSMQTFLNDMVKEKSP